MVTGPCASAEAERSPANPFFSGASSSRLRRRHAEVLTLVAVVGALIFLLGLGETGVVDETPALFAASARTMAESGDWLIPQVNGLPRYDKPPLVYWLMASIYSLPWHDRWDPLGSLAARLPSALASITTMLLLADTVLRWPQGRSEHAVTAGSAALVFALGPLVLVWGRTEVSDALFTATLAMSFLLAWRTYADQEGPWWPCWVALALAVLSKGPVALMLFPLTLVLFQLLGAEGVRIWRRLRPGSGLLLTLALSAPWYGLALWREGQRYWESFFGYHNLQRYIRVVNHHQQGWWYFFLVLVVASLPFTPLLLWSLWRVLLQARAPLAASQSLGRFAAAWLLAVLAFFTLSSTKLPSYWLVATPATALLMALALPSSHRDPVETRDRRDPGGERLVLWFSAGLLLVVSIGLAASPLWLAQIRDPTLPGLQDALINRPIFPLGAAIALLAGALLVGWGARGHAWRLLQSQLALLLLVPLVLLPLWRVGDQLRGAPLRALAAVARQQLGEREGLAMVGMRKPSLHFYSRRIVLFEGRSATALVNLADRLEHERRAGLHPTTVDNQPKVMVMIDNQAASEPHWQDWEGRELAAAGAYRLWRVDRRWLLERARLLQEEGKLTNWRDPRPERF